jgi:hypothetical protein
MLCPMTVIKAWLCYFSKRIRTAFLIVCSVILYSFVTVTEDRIAWILLDRPCFCAALTKLILRTIEKYFILQVIACCHETKEFIPSWKIGLNIAYSTNSVPTTFSQPTSTEISFIELLLLLLLLQGYRPLACFRLRQNTSSRLAMGRPILRSPLGLIFSNIVTNITTARQWLSLHVPANTQ